MSKSFQATVWKIISSIASDIPAFNPVLETVERSLQRVAKNLKFVKCLYTRFLLLPKTLDITRVAKESMVPEWEEGTRHRSLYFVDQFKTSILVAEPPNYVSAPDLIAIVISRVLDSPITLPIGSLLFCPEGSEATLATVLKLCSHKNVTDQGAGIVELLGKDILPQDALQVQFLPLRPFYKGEIVAWRSQSGEKLKYGRVVDNVKPLAGQALYRFKVETSSGVTELLISSHVFSFRCVSISGEAAPVTKLEDNQLASESRSVEVSGQAKPSSPEVNME